MHRHWAADREKMVGAGGQGNPTIFQQLVSCGEKPKVLSVFLNDAPSSKKKEATNPTVGFPAARQCGGGCGRLRMDQADAAPGPEYNPAHLSVSPLTVASGPSFLPPCI